MVQFTSWVREITSNYYVPSESITAEDYSWQILLVYYNIILSGEWKRISTQIWFFNEIFLLILREDRDSEKLAIKYNASDLSQY